jgi:hypothetical protein
MKGKCLPDTPRIFYEQEKPLSKETNKEFIVVHKEDIEIFNRISEHIRRIL